MEIPRRNLVLRLTLRCSAAALALVVAQQVHAQDQVPAPEGRAQTSIPDGNAPVPTAANPADPTVEPTDSADLPTQDIIVTGTLLRGVAPAGSSTIGLTRESITASGANNTAQLLANVPQLGSFGQRPTALGTAAQSVNRLNIRNLPGSNGGGSASLLLVDGHRMPGMGIQQTYPDLDAIAPGAIERVEIVPDGGSSTYGADAVGGVVNLITRRRFDGVEASARYGTAANYRSVDGSVTLGKTWEHASAFVSYNYEWHDPIYGRDRDFVRRRDYVNNVPLDLTCTPGNVAVGSTIYALPGLTAGLGNRCDISDNRTFYPEVERHSVFAGVSAGNGPVTVDLRGFYLNRVTKIDGGPLTASVTIAPINIYTGARNTLYRSVGGTFGAQTVSFDFPQTTSKSRIKLESWQIAPSMTIDLGKGWQLRTLFSYGRGVNQIRTNVLNSSLLSDLVLRGQFDPYNLGAAVNAPYLSALSNYADYGYGVNELINTRAIADGTLFKIPGGDVKVAVGAEYLREQYKVVAGTGVPGQESLLPNGAADRNTAALFGEVQVPVFSSLNAVPAIHSLSLSGSARYDNYSDFGGTFNPKVGATYEPISWFALRGSWGKSFQAPSLADSSSAASATLVAVPIVLFPSPLPGQAPAAGQGQLFLSGGGVNLKPQKATTWSFGGKIKPPFATGLSIEVNYYNIKFRDLIDIPPVFRTSIFYRLYGDKYIINPTIAQINAFAAQASNPTVAAAYVATPGRVYSIADGRRANFANVKTDGLDFGLNYNLPTSFGSIYANFNGTYVLSRDQEARAGAGYVSLVDSYSRFLFGTTAGATIGNLRAQATLNHTGGYDVTPTVANLQQTNVGAFNVVNLYFEYGFKSTGLLQDVALTLNVENVGDVGAPPLREGDGYSGLTLGRLFQFGIRKKF